MSAPTTTPAVEAIAGVSHWVTKQHASGPIRLYAWEKNLPSREGSFAGTILLVHGSSMASTPTFDLQVPGHGEAHSGPHGKNYRTTFHVMQSYRSQPAPVYLG